MLQFSERYRNARGDAMEATTGASAKLLFFSAAKSANCAASDPSGLLATLTLPTDWMDDAAAGVTTMLGSWTGTASGAGTIASFRIKDSALANCDMQGSVTITDGGGEMEVDSVTVASGQTIVVTSFAITEGNA